MNVIAIDFDNTASVDPHRVNKLYEDPLNFIVIYTSRSSKIRKIFKTVMGQVAVQGPALMDRVTAALTPGSKEIKAVMATIVVTISRIIRGVNSSNSRVIRATRSS